MVQGAVPWCQPHLFYYRFKFVSSTRTALQICACKVHMHDYLNK